LAKSLPSGGLGLFGENVERHGPISSLLRRSMLRRSFGGNAAF